MRTTLLVIASVALFVLAAKAHGRELRLERQAAGIAHVVFGGANPPLVEALWRAERIRFWSLAPLLTLALGAALLLGGASLRLAAPAALTGGPVVAFALLGAASVARAGLWERGHLAGSAAWWALVLTLAAVIGLAVWRTT